jgi:hypothetical protein
VHAASSDSVNDFSPSTSGEPVGFCSAHCAGSGEHHRGKSTQVDRSLDDGGGSELAHPSAELVCLSGAAGVVSGRRCLGAHRRMRPMWKAGLAAVRDFSCPMASATEGCVAWLSARADWVANRAVEPSRRGSAGWAWCRRLTTNQQISLAAPYPPRLRPLRTGAGGEGAGVSL